MEAPKNPPETIKIGWATYKIQALAPGEAAGDRIYGKTNSVACIISMDFNLSPSQSAHTLLHEICHAIYVVWHIADDDKEEETVSALSSGLATVWRDNPEVFAWIDDNLTARETP